MDQNRRNCVKTLGLLALVLSSRKAPAFSKNRKPTLRVLGTHVTLQEALRQKAQKELGFNIEFFPGGSSAILHQAQTRPESFDLYEQWSDSINVLWQANAIQSIDIRKLRHWDEINSLTKTGRLTPDAALGAGDAPYKLLYRQKNGDLDSKPTQEISFLPYVHNTDSFGYDTRYIDQGIAYETESWGWLLDPRWLGKVALVNAPTIGIFDAVLATKALKLVNYKDIGNLTRGEIDSLFEVLVELRQQGHFRGVWGSVPKSVELMSKGDVYIQSMFSPAVASLNGMGIPCIYAAPKEGYRAWHGVMCLSAAANDLSKDMAYEYMNWWLSGWPGAFIARQGYYISNPQRSKPFLSQEEWDYWYQGLPAAKDLHGTDGKISVKKGSIRNGGAYEKRFSNVAVWNTVMDQFEYTLEKWNEF